LDTTLAADYVRKCCELSMVFIGISVVLDLNVNRHCSSAKCQIIALTLKLWLCCCQHSTKLASGHCQTCWDSLAAQL